ncbi:MAG: endonuclease, partial [Winogradskyella sp.]|nr:endonuclease [Winogradskyella sp.]
MMKGLKLYDKILFLLNSFSGILLLLSYLLQYIPPSKFPLLSVLSLGVPLLLIINVLFFVYWLLKLKRQVLLSLIILLVGFKYLSSLYNFSGEESESEVNSISILNYNVRLFNAFNWSPSKTIREDIVEFLETKQPDIITLQEYRQGIPVILEDYFDYNASYIKNIRGGQVIYSKFPIVNAGSLEFPKTFNNAIFVDLKIKQDTVRVYNLHLQSTGIKPDVESLKKEDSQNLIIGLASTFKKQQVQAEILLKHMKDCPYKIIISG